MKRYSNFLLFATTALTACSFSTAVQAGEIEAGLSDTNVIQPLPKDPTLVNQSMKIEQRGNLVSIFYNRSPQQEGYKIQYAVWSNENGQDDIRWYVAGEQETEFSLVNHSGYGNYTVHAYIVIQDRLVFLDAGAFTRSKPQPSLTSSISEVGALDITVQNLPENTTEVRIPTWSSQNGQDDIVWYTASQNEDGSYGLRIPLNAHNFDTGNYESHVYIKENGQASQKYMAKVTTLVENGHVPLQPKPTFTIENLDVARGTYQVVTQETLQSKKIKSVDVATWSMDKQANIKWRKANLVNGAYQVAVDFQEHKNHPGIYQNHVYVTYTDGKRSGYAQSPIDLTGAKIPVEFQAQFLSAGTMQLTAKNIYSEGEVRFAVWSDENNQDDLKWYTASPSADQTYSLNLLLSNHKGIGKYHVHIYQNGKGLKAATMEITAAQKDSTPNTYPVGQCTWGVKEAAPWVGNWWGHARTWANSAKNAGFTVGTTPKVGAIAVWTDGSFGHVAFVTQVNSPTQIRVKESNYEGKMYLGDFRGWFNPVADGVTAYIYPN
ncbi:GBS Bsp-like repeat-containing protein [Streptococcus sp. 20-1249]|uniref:GBS Bsp-like repeat-containing protein n=1 Tax=Streptococcus hepaticus TaxID=3349163 RepID=UPI0037487856